MVTAKVDTSGVDNLLTNTMQGSRLGVVLVGLADQAVLRLNPGYSCGMSRAATEMHSGTLPRVPG